MIGRRQLPELRIFAKAEERFTLRADPKFGNLVVPNGNGEAAIHRWFKYKEAFSSELLKHVIEKIGAAAGKENIRLLDPFCGVGTGLLSAQMLSANLHPIGIECNPFSAFVATTKLGWHGIEPPAIRSLAKDVLSAKGAPRINLPALSSIASGRCISRHMARQIMIARDAIGGLPAGINRDALALGLASVIEPVSRVRRDGRALRIVDKPHVTFRRALAERWEAIAADVETLKSAHSLPNSAQILLGDGRKPLSAGIPEGSVDVILTSPPYPNNIDYNEVYKLELWFLGFANTADEFLSLRRSTFRSHPTCSLLDEADESSLEFARLLEDGALEELMGMVLRRVERVEGERRRGRTKVLVGYIHDTWLSLREHFKVLRPGGYAFYVVGNSLHGGASKPYLIPTDLIFAQLAQEVGFKVEEVVVARGLQRRLAGNHFLRDSVVMLRKV